MYAGQLIESGPREAVLGAASHPYAQALLRSSSRLTTSKARLTPIAGNLPDLAALPAGCRFAPRCDRRMDICNTVPPDVAIAPDHDVLCWLYARKPA